MELISIHSDFSFTKVNNRLSFQLHFVSVITPSYMFRWWTQFKNTSYLENILSKDLVGAEIRAKNFWKENKVTHASEYLQFLQQSQVINSTEGTTWVWNTRSCL